MINAAFFMPLFLLVILQKVAYDNVRQKY